MKAIVGITLVFAGYVGIVWSVMLITGKNVGVGMLFSDTWPPAPPPYTGCTPTAQAAASSSTATTAEPKTTTGMSQTTANALTGGV